MEGMEPPMAIAVTGASTSGVAEPAVTLVSGEVVATGTVVESPAARLHNLKGLLDAGAITQAEYDAKKDELLPLL